MSRVDRPSPPVPDRCAPAAAGPARPPPAPCRVSSRELLGVRGEIEIDHAGAVYRLRITSQGKLILTK